MSLTVPVYVFALKIRRRKRDNKGKIHITVLKCKTFCCDLLVEPSRRDGIVTTYIAETVLMGGHNV